MKALLLASLVLLAALPAAAELWPRRDQEKVQELKERQTDWRNGAVVYQVFVDRFAPSRDLEAKRSLYEPPRRLRAWSELPKSGVELKEHRIWSHEVDYWGGDLDSLHSKLDYLEGLGVDVVYLNPIFESLSNHKYDASDYHQVDKVYGDRAELKKLADALHARGMRLILDGVFNHMGRRSPLFQSALKDPEAPEREFFQWNNGEAVGWADVENLPELKLENKKVRDFIYGSPDSVVQSYLKQEGIDGWRLDVAFDLGFRYLEELTATAHQARPGCAIIGEIWSYPEDWHPAVDGVMNMHGRLLLLGYLQGSLSGPLASSTWQTMVDDAGYDHILKAWLVLDNHDTPRLNHILPEPWQVEMARVLQFTLPGSVNLYYGSELGMEGGEDPENRAPMRWDLVNDDNSTLAFHRRLLKIRRENPALRYGDFRRLHTAQAFGFLRKTVSARETVIVLANATEDSVTELLQLPDGKLQDLTPVKDLLGSEVESRIRAGTLEITLQPRQTVVLVPVVAPSRPGGYDRYDRIP